MDNEALHAKIRTYQQLLANAQDQAITAEILLRQADAKLQAANTRIKELEPEQPASGDDS